MIANEEQRPEPTGWSDAALDAAPVLSHRARHRLGWVAVAVLLLILLTVLPPLLNVNRYQRRVAQAISDSIGRPVHFDAIHLHLLPLPGLTIQNFVVEEDPAFGSEPALRANTVEARLRLASLWRRRVEVSHITLRAPSINLVRRADGRWSLQGVVTEAGYLQSAPTVQGHAGTAPRFPYIEATDARVNIKSGENKLPWSLLDARLALWLPDQNEWRLRLRGRPLRTDTDVSDVGELQLEGSLGRRAGGGVTDQPLAIAAKWSSTPLGEAAKLFIGRDTGFRGAASAELDIRGTPAHMQLSSDLHLHNLRRTEFVPRLPMSVDAHCEADATGVVHALHNLRCAIPTAQSAGLFEGAFRSHDQPVKSAPGVVFVQAELPDITAPHRSTVTLDLADAESGYFLNWLRVFSSRVPEAAEVRGTVRVHALWDGSTRTTWLLNSFCQCTLTPALPPAASGSTAPPPAYPGGTTLPPPAAPGNSPWLIQVSVDSNAPVDASLPGGIRSAALQIIARQAPPGGPAPFSADLGGTVPPAVVANQFPPLLIGVDARSDVVGSVSRGGLVVSYPSYDVAHYAAVLLPPLGDRMPAPTAAQLTSQSSFLSERVWGQPPQWTVQSFAATPLPKHPRRARR